MIKVGLCIDVDIFCGICEGVSCLLEILSKYNIQVSIFFSVGLDNMGCYFWRLVKLQFLWKMLCLNVVSFYGWDILLVGMVWLGKEIGYVNVDIICEVVKYHEVGLYVWDYYVW